MNIMNPQTKWNEAFTAGRDYEVMNKLLLKKVLTEVPIGKALDLGCGTGELACSLAQGGFEATGLDVSDVAIKKAESRAAELGVVVKFAQADFSDIN